MTIQRNAYEKPAMNAALKSVRMYPHKARRRRILVSMPESGPSLLLLEAATPEQRVEAVESVFDGLEQRERAFLIRHPDDLGRRCESVLSGIAPDELDSLLLPGDHKQLRVLAVRILHAVGGVTSTGYSRFLDSRRPRQ